MSFNKLTDPRIHNLINALTATPKRNDLSGLSGLFAPPPANPLLNIYPALGGPATPKEAPTMSLPDLNALIPTVPHRTRALGSPMAPLPKQPKSDPLVALLVELGTRPGSSTGLDGLTAPRPNPPVPPFPGPAAGKRRRAFFSFHFDDVIRVNNVRKAFEFQQPDKVPSFYDSSLWESRRLEDPDAIKRLIREGVENTSVVCVLVGTHTWLRRWVRYEVARSVIDRKALLAVSVNGLNHHRDRRPHPPGPNPLNYMAVGKMPDGTYRLFEWKNDGWYRYDDYTLAVTLPAYLPDPLVGYVTPLSKGTMLYDYVAQQGYKNIGGWIDLAAAMAGR